MESHNAYTIAGILSCGGSRRMTTVTALHQPGARTSAPRSLQALGPSVLFCFYIYEQSTLKNIFSKMFVGKKQRRAYSEKMFLML
jgi:hypothetical protein